MYSVLCCVSRVEFQVAVGKCGPGRDPTQRTGCLYSGLQLIRVCFRTFGWDGAGCRVVVVANLLFSPSLEHENVAITKTLPQNIFWARACIEIGR